MSAYVAGSCPACGDQSLRLGEGGHITCSRMGCINPGAVDEILADREIYHQVTFTRHDFTIRHPLIERVRDALTSCDLHAYCRRLDGPPSVTLGLHRAVRDGSEWTFIPLGQPEASERNEA